MMWRAMLRGCEMIGNACWLCLIPLGVPMLVVAIVVLVLCLVPAAEPRGWRAVQRLREYRGIV